MPMIRGGGCHWRHLEIVSFELAAMLMAKQGAGSDFARTSIELWPRPGFPPAFPLRRTLFTRASMSAISLLRTD